jgi:hypothetical protein
MDSSVWVDVSGVEGAVIGIVVFSVFDLALVVIAGGISDFLFVIVLLVGTIEVGLLGVVLVVVVVAIMDFLF